MKKSCFRQTALVQTRSHPLTLVVITLQLPSVFTMHQAMVNPTDALLGPFHLFKVGIIIIAVLQVGKLKMSRLQSHAAGKRAVNPGGWC